MSRLEAPAAESASPHGQDPPPQLGERLGRICERFSERGILGVVLVDASPLAEIELSAGHPAYQRAMAALAALMRDVASERLDGEERVVAGETGRAEIAVLMFRTQDDVDFHRRDLPALVRGLEQAFAQQGHRVVYPYSRKSPALGVGYAVAVRNPHLGAAAQLRAALEEAREDAQLSVRTSARERRKAFLDLILAGEVSSVYEPIVDVGSKTVFGYEALVRGPQGTAFHSPLALFAAAEEEGLIYELDCLCRRSGLGGAVGLPSGTKLFLNVRPTTIHDPSFRPEALIRTLSHCELRPSDVVFEISEQESITNFDVFREVRDEYGKLGFQIALDDTGAGHSSLQGVIELEPDYIKVDRAFVHGIDTDPARQSMLRALHAVAGGIGARIIGEGLDTLEELEMLGKLGIPFGQGWLFGKPHPLRASGDVVD